MNPISTLPLPCVTVSTTETPVSDRVFTKTTGSVTAMERRLIRALVKEYGWRTTQQGIIKPGHLGWGNL